MNVNQSGSSINEEAFSFKDYLNLIKLNLVPILIFTFLGLAIALAYAITSPNIFISTTLLKVSKPQGSILDGSLLPDMQDFGSDRFIANEIEILKSNYLREIVAKDLIDTFKVNKNKNDFSLILRETGTLKTVKGELLSQEEIADMLTKKVAINQKSGLDIIEISVESPSAYESALIANTYARVYRQVDLNYNRIQLTIIKEFLEKQRNEKLAQLSNMEDILKSFQEKKGVVELSEQAKALIGQSSDFQAKLNAAQIELTISDKTLTNYKEELKKKDPDVSNYIENLATEPYLKKLQEQIADLKTQRDRAMTSQSANSQKIINEADRKINELKEKLNSSLSVYRAGVLASSPDEIKELAKKAFEEEVQYQANSVSVKKLNEIVGNYNKQINELPTNIIDYARLKREQEAAVKLYELVDQRYQEAIINEQSVPGNVLIIDAAVVPIKHAKPNRILIVFIGLVLGVGVGFGFAFVKNLLDDSVKTPEDIQKKNIPMLSWIPEIEELRTGNKDFEFIVARKPDSRVSEAYRTMRTRIRFSKVDKESLKTILVTSPMSQEGKTTTAVNLAACFAQANYKTLILDTDLRKPRVHTIFKEKRYPGITDYFFELNSFEEIVRKTEVENLYYVSSGTIPPNPSEILGSAKMVEFIAMLKTKFDYIILDSPPIIAVTDSEIMAELVDSVLLVVSANKTELEMMEKSAQTLMSKRGSFLGIVLNNFTYRNGYSSYYKHYYYYSNKNEEGKPGARVRKRVEKADKNKQSIPGINN